MTDKMKYKLIDAVTNTNGQIVPKEQFTLPDGYGYMIIFNDSLDLTEPDIKYFAIPDENGTLTIDEVNEMRLKGMKAFRERQLKRNPPKNDYNDLYE